MKKHKVASKIMCASWRPDGAILAIGTLQGDILLVDSKGVYNGCITRPGAHMISSLSWCQRAPLASNSSNPSNHYSHNNNNNNNIHIRTKKNQHALVIGTWDKSITIFDAPYTTTSEPSQEWTIDGYPLSLSSSSSSSCDDWNPYLFISSHDSKIFICNPQGVVISTLTVDTDSDSNSNSDWIWQARYCSGGGDYHGQGRIVTSSCKGEIQMLNLHKPILYSERNGWIAYGQGGTKAIVHNLQCHKDVFVHQSSIMEDDDVILGMDVNDKYLAIHVKSNIMVYTTTIIGSSSDEKGTGTDNFEYKLAQTHTMDYAFDVFAIIGDKILVVQNENLRLYYRQGGLVQSWSFDTNITCIKVTHDHIPGSESVLVGHDNGVVMEVTMDHAFPIPLFALNENNKQEIKMLTTSCNHCLIGVVDQMDQLHVYDRIEKQFMPHMNPTTPTAVKNIIFHDTLKSLYCYQDKNDGSGSIIIRDQSCTTKLLNCEATNGTVVKFTGSKLTILHRERLVHCIVDLVPLIEQKVEEKSFQSALSIANLGVGTLTWEFLALKSMAGADLDVAESCFSYLEEGSKVSMIRRLKETFATYGEGLTDDIRNQLIAAEIDIANGCFQKASDRLVSIGEHRKAIHMLASMGMFQDAKEVIPKEEGSSAWSEEKQKLALKEAEWEEGMQRWKEASELYAEAGAYGKAVEVTVHMKGDDDEGLNQIYAIATRIPVEEMDALNLCCEHLAQHPGNESRLKEILTKMGDYSQLMALYINMQAWLDVSNLRREQEGNYDKSLLLPYADWLAVQDNLKGALEVNRDAGRDDRSFKLLSYLIKEAKNQQCYRKVSHLYFTTANLAATAANKQCIGQWLSDDPSLSVGEMKDVAVLFHVYEQITDYSLGIFSVPQPHNMVQGCLFLINSITQSKVPKGISETALFTIFCELARDLGGYVSARIGYDLLSFDQSLSDQQKEKLDENMMTIEVSFIMNIYRGS